MKAQAASYLQLPFILKGKIYFRSTRVGLVLFTIIFIDILISLPFPRQAVPQISAGLPRVDRTYKLFYGGAQKRPDGNYSRTVLSASGSPIAQVAESNRKDVRNAVEAAHKGQPGWAKRSGHQRAQILFYLAENLELRRAEFAETLVKSVGCSQEEAEKEVRKGAGCRERGVQA